VTAQKQLQEDNCLLGKMWRSPVSQSAIVESGKKRRQLFCRGRRRSCSSALLWNDCEMLAEN